MQIFYLSSFWMITSFIVGWAVFQGGAALIGNRMPDYFFKDEGLFKDFKFESDSFYRRTFKIDKWKELLPDGAAVHKRGFRKKRLESKNSEYIKKFILESKRAEFVHWIAILPFWIFGFWAPPIVIPIMFLYGILVNIPCIIAQRYNRPRLRRILNRMELRAKGNL